MFIAYCAGICKFPENGTSSALLSIEQIVQECDATMLNRRTSARLKKNELHILYDPKSRIHTEFTK